MYDRATMDAYDRDAAAWVSARRLEHGPLIGELLDSTDGPVVDLGCGPGWHLAGLDGPAVALDISASMLALVPDHAPNALRVRASLDALPFRFGSIATAVASRTLVHLRAVDVPAALADLHRALAPGAPVFLHLFGDEFGTELVVDGPFPGRRFSGWDRAVITELIEAAGFAIEQHPDGRDNNLVFVLRRARTLPDWVGPDMRLLICGLNPSLHAADAGVGFVSPSNRFWPAAVDAGVVDGRCGPSVALRRHGIGMTDLVKRATRRAAELRPAEYRAGLDRLDRMVGWLQPGAVCFVGLSGWRAAVDRQATAGPLDRLVGGRPVYLMPSTSGLNARVGRAELVEHFRAAAELADRSH